MSKQKVTNCGSDCSDQHCILLNDDHIDIRTMTEKHEEITAQRSSNSSFQTVLDPPKVPLVDDPLHRGFAKVAATQPPLEEQPAGKEGYNYWNHLPYEVEDDATRIANLNDTITDLYTCIRAGDFDGGARTSSRQIRRWLHLKFKMPKETRIKLCKLYYQLSLTPGIDPSAADTFANMFRLLASYGRCFALS